MLLLIVFFVILSMSAGKNGKEATADRKKTVAKVAKVNKWPVIGANSALLLAGYCELVTRSLQNMCFQLFGSRGCRKLDLFALDTLDVIHWRFNLTVFVSFFDISVNSHIAT